MLTEIITEEKIKAVEIELENDMLHSFYSNVKEQVSLYDKIKNPTEQDDLQLIAKVEDAQKQMDSRLEEIAKKLKVLREHKGETLLSCYNCRKAKDNWHCDEYIQHKFCSPGDLVSIHDFDIDYNL